MGLIVGLAAGLLGAGVGLFFALYALGFFQYLGGKKPDPLAVSKKTMQQALLALNDPSKPFHIVPGEDTDLIAEWKIVDASWYGIFSKSRLSKCYRAQLLLDEERHSVRCFEILGSVSWTVGTRGLTPSLHYGKNSFSGRILFQKSYGTGYGIKDPKSLEIGKVYQYKFDVDEIRGPIIAVVKANGWEWVPVTARRHAVYNPRGKIKPPSQSLVMEGKIFCRQCGGAINDQDIYCATCGKKV